MIAETSTPERASGPSPVDRLAAAVVLRGLEHVKRGKLTLRLPDGSVRRFGGEAEGPEAEVVVRRHSFFRRILLSGDIGLGEAYTAGDFETDDLTRLISLFIENGDEIERSAGRWALPGRLANRVRHLLRPNSTSGSRDNISAHYDLSNEFFGLFLDESMMYSGALFRSSEEDLSAGTRNKFASIIEKARLSPSDHVLEIGTGWGSFAIEAARRTGCRVTTLTISRRQFEHATRRVKEAGLADKVKVELRDYRHAAGSYDKIVSIEMIEAVGHEYLGTFFQALDGLLAPNGLVVLQAITVPDQRYEAYRRGCDWIQKHIFPGATVPSLTALADAMTSRSRLMIEDLENIGVHYARTLAEWRRRFHAAGPELSKAGFGEGFRRTWEYYFSYCEAGFATRTLGDLQLVLTRTNNKRLPAAVGA